MAGTANLSSRIARKIANYKSSAEPAARLDFPVLDGMFAQPLGSPSADMRNKITKLLIVVVPRHTAGGG
jgi:hypothetical protein